MLSDWTFESPYRLLAKLKKQPDYYNRQQRTVVDFFRDVRLRFINAGAASYFDVRIPGLSMQVVQVSGQHVKPVVVDEIRVAIAETYDVIVEPAADRAYTVYAEAMDRSGFVYGTLAPAQGMTAAVPDRRERPLLTMADMGMMHGEGEDMAGQEMGAMAGHDVGAMAAPADTAPAASHAGHDMSQMAMPTETAGVGWTPGTLAPDATHGPDEHGRGNAGVAAVATSRLDDPGLGLGDDGRRVLLYTDLESLAPVEDFRPPQREIELHLTGNMERFMWSINGVKYSDAEPIHVTLGERFRLVLLNDTMMNHPMHLHGMWLELENGKGRDLPRVHTVNVKPAERVSFLATPEVAGPWAFHCHVLYHMDAGMFRVFQVVDDGAALHQDEGDR
jgi:CopA family copper-resistance protein